MNFWFSYTTRPVLQQPLSLQWRMFFVCIAARRRPTDRTLTNKRGIVYMDQGGKTNMTIAHAHLLDWYSPNYQTCDFTGGCIPYYNVF